MIDDLARDLRYAARMLRRSSGFTVAAVVSLALGIGANTAIFSIVDRLMFRSLPLADASRLVIVQLSPGFVLNYGLYERFRDQVPRVADLAAIVRTDRYNAGPDDGAVRLSLVSGSYLSTLGITATIGRVFGDEDDKEGAEPVAVISDSYWETRFQRSRDAIGRTLNFSGEAYTIVGVAPRGFTGEWVGRPADVWAPIVHQPRVMVELPVGGLRMAGVAVVGRLAPNVTIGQAESALQTVLQQWLREADGPNPTAEQLQMRARQRVEVVDGSRGYSPQRESFGRSLTILMLAVGLVLLVACANIANLLLARSESRQREMAVRAAIGASRTRIVQQLLTESLLLSAAGGALGLVFARWATSLLVSFMHAGPVGNVVSLSMDLNVEPDARFLGVTALLCLTTGILFGIAPAFKSSRLALAPALSARGAANGAGGRFGAGRLLVVSQVAVSLVLLVGAGLFVRTLWNLSTQDLGFDREHVLLVWALPGQTSGRGAAASDYWRRLQDRLSGVPGVQSVSASNQGVLNGMDLSGLPAGGPGLRIDGAHVSGQLGVRSFVTPGFFKTMGIALAAGRDFAETDTAAAPRVVIISQTMARYYFGDRNPIGRRVAFPEDGNSTTEIIGVSHDFAAGSPREVGHRPMQTYFSYRDKEASRRLRGVTIAVRTAGDPRAIASSLRRALHAIDPNLPVLKIDTVDEQLSDVLVQERLVATLSAFFGGLAVLLACIGLYGVIAFTVARRTSEIGIRLALGATGGQVLRAVMAESLMLVAVGIGIGVPATLALTRLVAARLFGVGPTDAPTIAGAIGVMVMLSALAAWLPARRAAGVDPMMALRAE